MLTPIGARGLGDRGCSVYSQGNHSLGMQLPKPNACSAHCRPPTPASSRATWEDKGDNKPQRMFAAEQRAILVSKSVYLEHSCLEESLPLLEMERGTRLDVGGETAAGEFLEPMLSALVRTQFLRSRGPWGTGDFSPHTRLLSPLNPMLPHQGEHAGRQSPQMPSCWQVEMPFWCSLSPHTLHWVSYPLQYSRAPFLFKAPRQLARCFPKFDHLWTSLPDLWHFQVPLMPLFTTEYFTDSLF